MDPEAIKAFGSLWPFFLIVFTAIQQTAAMLAVDTTL
jgi:hypothetical protein